MQTLLDFLVRFRYLLLFLFLETVCVILMSRHADMRDNVVFSTAGSVSGLVCELSSSVSDYFGLRTENRKLVEEIASLRAQLYELRDSAELAALPKRSDSSVSVARVIDNTVNRNRNFITIDKGSFDGIVPGMCVYESLGAVGIIYKVSHHYALVLPLINTDSNLSCKVRSEDCFGFLKWDGNDVRNSFLTDLPSHCGVEVGDTVETSGFSTVFPRGIPVGTVIDVRENDASSPQVTVRLAVDFSRLEFVYVGTDVVSSELTTLIPD